MRCAALILVALGMALAAQAEQLRSRGTVDPRIRVASYGADQVYRLYAYVGYQIDLEFEPGETYVGIGGGDLEGLTLGAFDNHLLLKPKAANIGTNLTVFTNRRHYYFEYSAALRRPAAGRDLIMYAVRFTYPSVPVAVGPSPEERVEAGLAGGSAHRARNID